MLYCDIHSLLDRFLQHNEDVKYMQYCDFYEIKKIGAGGYGTVYTANYRKYSKVVDKQETVVLKQFKKFDDQTSDLFISEVSNNW